MGQLRASGKISRREGAWITHNRGKLKVKVKCKIVKPPLTNLIEELNLLPLRKQRRRDRVHGRVAPPLVVEPAALVEVVEEGGVRGPAPELEVGDLEVGPDWRGD